MLLNNKRFLEILVRAWQVCPPGNPMHLRCHEIARFLASAFQMEGFKGVKVCDGFAVYRTDYLVEMIKRFSPICGCLSFRTGFREDKTDQEIIDSIICITKVRDLIDFHHSWCELLFSDSRWLIDFHPNMFIPDQDGNELGKLSWWSAHKIESAPIDELKYWHLSCGQEIIEDGRRFIEVQRPDMADWCYKVELRAMPEFYNQGQ